jgi:nucleotide-binding universal stress UspA family protein
MSTAVRPFANSFAASDPAKLLDGPVLVASDSSPHSDAAFPIAHALAAQTGARVQVMSALRPFAMPMYAFDSMPVVVETDTAVRAAREAMVRAQMARLTSPDTDWPMVIRTGEPSREIVDCANEIKASMVVVGRGRHTAMQRALSGETVLRLLQLGDTPVLATEARLNTLPSRVVIATDFSEFSLYAAQVAMTMIAPNATVHLVHVAPNFDDTDARDAERPVAYENQVRNAFAQMHERLARDGVVFDDILLHGGIVDSLLKVLRSTHAELVVSATHGYGFLRRMILGSVAAEMIRQAPCSVLCVPGSARTLAATRARATTAVRARTIALDVRDVELHEFTKRNAGRPCMMELDSTDFGAQILGYALPLVGATYDHTARAVSLMFGSSTLAGRHLTHTIPEVNSIEILSDHDGHEQVLRIASQYGQTLLLLE